MEYLMCAVSTFAMLQKRWAFTARRIPPTSASKVRVSNPLRMSSSRWNAFGEC